MIPKKSKTAVKEVGVAKPKSLNIRNHKYYSAILACSITIIVYFILAFNPFSFIPDFLDFFELDKARLLLRTIIAVEGSVFSILFAILILHFNLSKETFGRSAGSIWINNKRQIQYAAFLITSICLSYLTMMLLKKEPSENVVTLVYFCSYLFLTVVISIFFVLLSSMNQSYTSKYVDDLINTIDVPCIISFYAQSNQSDLEVINEIEANPLYKIREIANNTSLKEETLIVQLIIKKTTEKAIYLISLGKSNIHPSQVINSFRPIWETIFFKSIEKKNEIISNYCWHIQFAFNKEIIKKRYLLKDFEELIDLDKLFLTKLIEAKFDSALKMGLSTISEVIKSNIVKNCSPEEELSDLNSFFEDLNAPYDFEKNQQWEQISHYYSDLFPHCLETAINSKNPQLFHEIQWQYWSHFSSLEHLTIGHRIKHLLTLDIYRHSFWRSKEAIEKQLFSSTDSMKFPEVNKIFEFLAQGSDYYKRYLVIVADFLVDMAEQNKLGEVYEYTLNFGALGRKLAQDYNKSRHYKTALHFVIDLICKLKDIFEKDESKSGRKYLKLIEELKSFKTWHEKTQPVNNELLKEIDNKIGAFKNAKKLQTEMNSKQIKWRDD